MVCFRCETRFLVPVFSVFFCRSRFDSKPYNYIQDVNTDIKLQRRTSLFDLGYKNLDFDVISIFEIVLLRKMQRQDDALISKFYCDGIGGDIKSVSSVSDPNSVMLILAAI